MKRYDIHVNQSTFEDVSLAAKADNKSMFAFTNEWLSEVTKLTREGCSPSELHGLYHSILLLKEMDAITLPADFFEEFIEREYKTNKAGLLEMFRNLGNRIATVTKMEARNLNELAELANGFVKLLPIKLFQLSIDATGNTAEINVVGAGKRTESSECATELLASMINAYGYTISDRDVRPGTIRLRATRLLEQTAKRGQRGINK